MVKKSFLVSLLVVTCYGAEGGAAEAIVGLSLGTVARQWKPTKKERKIISSAELQKKLGAGLISTPVKPEMEEWMKQRRKAFCWFLCEQTNMLREMIASEGKQPLQEIGNYVVSQGTGKSRDVLLDQISEWTARVLPFFKLRACESQLCPMTSVEFRQEFINRWAIKASELARHAQCEKKSLHFVLFGPGGCKTEVQALLEFYRRSGSFEGDKVKIFVHVVDPYCSTLDKNDAQTFKNGLKYIVTEACASDGAYPVSGIDVQSPQYYESVEKFNAFYGICMKTKNAADYANSIFFVSALDIDSDVREFETGAPQAFLRLLEFLPGAQCLATYIDHARLAQDDVARISDNRDRLLELYKKAVADYQAQL